MKKKIALLGLLMVCFLLSACSSMDKENANTNQNLNEVIKEQDSKDEVITKEPISEEAPVAEDEIEQQDDQVLKLELDDHDDKRMEKADGWSNGSIFDCTWRGDNITFVDGIMTMKIDRDYENSSTKWSGSEYRTKDFYHYGKYEVRMKPIKNDGVVSSFFTYTGPSDGNPWDEVDIEFLGKDTTKIQFNYFTNGVGGHEFIYELGFDASEEFHEYGFEWREDSITWYVDGVAVHTANEDIPSTPSKIMMNVWPGVGVDEWLNAFDGQVPLEAHYDWFSYTK